MLENNLNMERKNVPVDKEKYCEKCPKKLTKEFCTYCKFFLLYERDINNVYDSVEYNLDDFYRALEQDADQLIEMETSKENLLEGPIKGNAKTEIITIDKDKVILENTKKKDNKLEKLHLIFAATKKKVDNLLDLTVYKRRERTFLNGIKKASITNVLIRSSFQSISPEKNSQKKVYSDIERMRNRKKGSKTLF